jgi:hypothetical protein
LKRAAKARTLCDSYEERLLRHFQTAGCQIASQLDIRPPCAHLLTSEAREDNPLAPKAPHFPAKAKRVLFIYLPGGFSHVDSFDYKPKLIADAKAGVLYQGKRKLGAPFWEFKQRGKSGTWISDLFPNIAECADDLCIINSLRGDHNDDFQATMGIHSGW